MTITDRIYRIATNGYINGHIRGIWDLLVGRLAAVTLTAKSHQAEFSRVWDAVTLGRLKWYLAVTFFLGWGIPKILSLLPVSYLWPKAIYFWPKDIYYWNNSGHLPQFPRIFFWWSYLWVESDVFHQLGFVITGITILLCLVAYLRGQ